MSRRLKITCGSNEAGGMECLAPLASHLLTHSYNVELLAAGNAVKLLQIKNAELSFHTIETPVLLLEVQRYLALSNPDVVVTGLLGSFDNLDYAMIMAAKHLSIPVISILDSWMNYKERLFLDEQFTRPVFPNRLAVMDAFAYDEILQQGISENLLVMTGHPKFDTFDALRRRRSDKEHRSAIRRKIGIQEGQPVVVFFSHPIAQFYPDKWMGYDENDVYPILLNAFKTFKSESGFSLVVKEHPRGCSVSEKLKELCDDRFIYLFDADIDDLLVVADVAASMASTVLVFAAAIGIPCVSIQPNIFPDRDMNVLTRSGFLKPLADTSSIHNALKDGFNLAKDGVPQDLPSWMLCDGRACERIEQVIIELTQV